MRSSVLIVGAGPVGLTMGAELARYGVAVRVVDKGAGRTDKSKAVVVWTRTMELMSRMGCAEAFVEAGLKVRAANILSGREVIGHVRVDGEKTPFNYALMIPQSETERLLEEHLNRLGVKVERETELVGFGEVADGVRARLRHGDGSEEEVVTPWLVGCDGAHSAVRHGLGMEFEGSTQASDWVLADIHLKGLPVKGDELCIYWHAKGVLVVLPITPGRYRVIADVGLAKGAESRADPTMEEVQGILEERGPGGLVASDAVWLSTFRINERIVKEYRKGRVFLAGDAAHVHSPAGGQGMNTGMQDAINLAWKMAMVYRGTGNEEKLLGSYSVERCAVGRQVVADAGRLTTVATLRGEILQEIRNHVASLVFGLSAVRGAMAKKLMELSVGYGEGPLTVGRRHGSGGVAAGERFPVIDLGEPVGGGDVPRFAVYGESCAEAEALMGRYGGIVEGRVRAGVEAEWIYVVRPDGYVGLVARRGEWGEVEGYLKGVRGG